MPIPFLALTIAVLAAPGSPAQATGPAAAKPRPAELSFALRWVRQDPPAEGATAAPVPALLSAPTLSTVDGQVASLEWKDNSVSTFFVSLSPTLEPTDNNAKSEMPKGATVRLFWNLRFASKTLPGGLSSFALTGVTRLPVGESADAVIARFSLADPKTGAVTEYRLEGHADGGGKAAPAPAAAVVAPAPTVTTPVSKP